MHIFQFDYIFQPLKHMRREEPRLVIKRYEVLK
jgi:hypothetical protein